MPRRDLRREGRAFDLVVFDWDGTLADSTALIARAIQAACRDLGVPPPADSAAKYVIGLGFISAVKHVAPTLDPAEYRTFSAAYRAHYLAEEPEIPLFQGARELLEELDAAGYLIAVATGKSRAGLEHAIARAGLGGVFHATRCGDEGLPKPHPDMLLNLMSFLASAPERTLMIGDTTHDLELARNAGAAAVAVTYGAHPASELVQAAPLAVVNSVGELRAWLEGSG